MAKPGKQLDPVKTRESIMRAALKLFADRGPDGASIADIAQAAKVPKSLIQYHFGTKEQLWNACLERLAAPMILAIDHMLASGKPDLPQLMATRFKFMRDNPEVRRLIGWASLGNIPAPQFIVEKREQLMDSFVGDLKRPQLARLLFVLSATDGWFHFRNMYRSVVGDQILSDEVEREFLEILLEVAPKFE